MKTRTKIVIVIFLAVLYFAFTQHLGIPARANADLPRNLEYWFEAYNSEYFQDKLPKDTVVDWGEHNDDLMGSTSVLPDGRFHIALSRKNSSPERVMRLVILHEDCHIQTFSEINDRYPKSEHGPRWRTCMLNLYQQGAFKKLLIDGYRGN